MKFLKSALIAVALIGSSAPAFAQPGWERLGSREVSDRKEIDVIRARGNDRYRKIRICVHRRAVRFYDVDVYFRNGGHQDVKMRRRIGPGGCTRAIDLKGRRRDITRVRFKYETSRDRGPQAIVSLWAR